MTIPFAKGDRIRLTDRYAGALNRAIKAKIDWRIRRGVVKRCNGTGVYVAWEGRTSLDPIPVNGVEKVT